MSDTFKVSDILASSEYTKKIVCNCIIKNTFPDYIQILNYKIALNLLQNLLNCNSSDILKMSDEFSFTVN